VNIYAIRDRLIDYYMRAFSAPDDKDVLASIAATINEGDPNSALAKAPHHFEIWRLGKVTEEGDLRPGKELIADCASLVRDNIRPATPSSPELLRLNKLIDASRDRLTKLETAPAPYNGSLPHPTRPEDQPGAQTPGAPPTSPLE